MTPTDDQVIEWALKAGLTGLNVRILVALKNFAGMASDAGMEHAAKLCDEADKSAHPSDLADAIRKEITK
jgi:hypothetical protein